MNPLLELAAKVEAATGPDRELADRVMITFGWTPPVKSGVCGPNYVGRDLYEWHDAEGCPRGFVAPNPLASLDAAMSLVPPSYHVAKLCEGEDDNPVRHKRSYTGRWHVRLHTTTSGVLHNLEYGSSATPALALTAACLRAHAAQETTR